MPPVGIEPTTDWLLTTSAFAALAVRGLDFAFVRSGRSPSSLYTFAFSALGSALPVKGSPNLKSDSMSIPTQGFLRKSTAATIWATEA